MIIFPITKPEGNCKEILKMQKNAFQLQDSMLAGLLSVMGILFISLASASTPIYVKPLDNATIFPDTYFNYEIFIGNENCTDIYFNQSERILTNDLGIGFINLSEDIGNAYYCEYRDGKLRLLTFLNGSLECNGDNETFIDCFDYNILNQENLEDKKFMDKVSKITGFGKIWIYIIGSIVALSLFYLFILFFVITIRNLKR